MKTKIEIEAYSNIIYMKLRWSNTTQASTQISKSKDDLILHCVGDTYSYLGLFDIRLKSFNPVCIRITSVFPSNNWNWIEKNFDM